MEVATSKKGCDIHTESKEVATSFSGRNSSCTERRSRRHLAVATIVARKGGRDIIQWSRHQLQRVEVATSFSSHEIRYNESRSRHHFAVATSYPRNAKSKSRPNKSFCNIAETTEVAKRNLGRDTNNQIGQLT